MAQSHGLGKRDVILRARVILIALVMCVAGVNPRVQAQGTSGMLADPLGLVELTELLEQGAVQYRDRYSAIEAAHVKYLAACAELRSTQIEKLQESRNELSRGSGDGRKIMDQFAVALKRSLALDQALFEEIQLAFPIEDHTGLARARAERERHTLRRALLTEGGPIGDADIPMLLRRLDWRDIPEARSIRQECHLALGDFDARHGKLMRELSAAAIKASTDLATMFEGQEELLGGGRNPEEPSEEQLRAQMEFTQTAYAKAFDPVKTLHRALRSSGQRGYRAVRDALLLRDARLARRFRLAYIDASYPYLAKVSCGAFMDSSTLRALRLKRLDQEQRAAIRLLYGEWQPKDDRIVDELLVVEDRRRDRDEENLLGIDHEALDAYLTAVDELKLKATGIAESTWEAMKSIIGADAQAIIDKSDTADGAVVFLPVGEVSLDGAISGPLDIAAQIGDGVGDTKAPNPTETVWLVNRMDEKWMIRISESLGLAAGPQAVLDSLKEDYWKAWDARIKPEASRLMLLVANMEEYLTTEDGNAAQKPAEPTPVIRDESDVARLVERAAALTRVQREVENQFFADVASVVAEPAQTPIVEMLRVARICGDRLDGLDSMFDHIPGGEENANVVLAITDAHLSAAECAQVAKTLAPHLSDLQRTAELWQAAITEYFRVEQSHQLAWRGFREIIDHARAAELSRLIRTQETEMIAKGLAAAQAKAASQRAAFDAAIAVVPEAARSAVQCAFLRDGYFTAMEGNEPAADALSRACALTDLTESQRGALSIARDDYTTERGAAVAGMIDHMRTGTPKEDSDRASVADDDAAQIQRWTKVREQAEEVERYSFARDAARDKLIVRLKNTLNEDQLRRAGIK
ncbi:MAG: hypothetical protein EXS15_06250 [Phycisphaerales bacterium]|nr:hypothetical protein [Phycisphaerales bacterium]